ncbi:MAG TPA: hypothetical protein VG777_08720, partial [Thermoanaerobaculia bacterium]|nr:hypothetical protein [Thermoanaerobaculia bacterium]
RFYSTAGEPLVSRDSLEIPGTATWSSLRWPPGELFRNPITVFTTGRRGRSAVRPVPGSLVRKLRSLGYLGAGSEAGNRPEEPDGAAAPGPSPARTIRIDVFSTLPAWTYPGESPLAEAHRFF